jgi:hypothetical protein
MTVHDTQAPRATSAGVILLDDVTASPAADWADHALACAAAYVHRLTSEGDLALTVAGLPGPLRLSVEPTTTLAELVERVRAARTSPVAAEAPATPVGTQVFLDADPVAVDDLALVLTLDADGRLNARARGNPERHSDEEVAAHTDRLSQFTRRLLEAGPTAEVGGIELLTPAEHHQIMHVWNDTAHPVPTLTLPELVEANAAVHPERTALSHRDQRLSYAELDGRASRIARLLIADGAGHGDIVAMVLPRSVDYVVTALAIVKTGAGDGDGAARGTGRPPLPRRTAHLVAIVHTVPCGHTARGHLPGRDPSEERRQGGDHRHEHLNAVRNGPADRRRLPRPAGPVPAPGPHQRCRRRGRVALFRARRR